MEGEKPRSGIIDSIERHIELLKPILPKQASQVILCMGEYPAKILLKKSTPVRSNGALPIFIAKSRKDLAKWSNLNIESNDVLGLDTDSDTHFWFQALPQVMQNAALISDLKNNLIDNVRYVIAVSSTWDGFGSASLPNLISLLKEWKINSVGFALLPSKIQPPDAHFNALASLSMFVSKNKATLLLADRDYVESYVGVDRKGFSIKGNEILNYLLSLMSTKEKIVQELTELSRSFEVKIFTILLATGTSLKIYGSIENILKASLLKPFLAFDLARASVLYILLRMPIFLKDKLPKEKIELDITNWFKERASFNSIHISEPIYVDDFTDRIDIVMFVGGFDITAVLTSLQKKSDTIKKQMVEQSFIKEDEWQALIEIWKKEKD